MSEKINNLDQSSYSVRVGLKRLLEDKSTKKNIKWATDNYKKLGKAYGESSYISADTFNVTRILNARSNKNEDIQLERTRKKAEVFTPSWVVNQMINYIDEEWFGYKDVFNKEKDKSWIKIEAKIKFPKNKTWKDYVDSRRLEITCGEAPYLVSRYDVVSGKLIEDLNERIGILDRKLRIVNENVKDKNEWKKWATRAIQASYGYEYQGDNLLLARINILLTYIEYYENRWKERPSDTEIKKLANIIAWNIWQMDGLKDEAPFSKKLEKEGQVSLFENTSESKENKMVACRIYDWRSNKSVRFSDIKEKEMKKFDFVIGNPPYDEITENNGRKKPLYHKFIDLSAKISDCTILIHPARFLFDAGQTPKKWNKKMLNSNHFKVLNYESDSNKVFPSLRNQIKGGVAITEINHKKVFEPIIFFTQVEILEKILHKVLFKSKKFLESDVSPRGNYRTTNIFFKDFTEASDILGKGTGNMIASNFFEKLPKVYEDYQENFDDKNFYKFLCRINNKREIVYIKKKYILPNEYLISYNIALPKSNGTGKFGEKLSNLEILGKNEGATDTFISIGKLNSEYEAISLAKYIKSKFTRALLGLKKVTQDNPRSTWSLVPLQDFTENSDIDWTKSVAEIDQELYKKYGLDDEEIKFIEEKVQEME